MISRICKAAIVALCIAHWAGAAVILPLAGHYRPGRYFPVSIDRSGLNADLGKSDDPLTIVADGAISTTLLSPFRSLLVVPVLATGGAVGEIRVGLAAAAQKPQPLDSRDCLVGVVGGAAADRVASAMFPGAHIILVHLDPTDPLPGPPIAWQSLDGVVLAERWPGSLQLGKLPQWLAGGMTVGVAAEIVPDRQLPWLPINGGWVLRPILAGPLGCDGNDEAYAPSTTWHPDTPAWTRWRIVVWTAAIIPLVLLAAKLPKRTGYPVVVITAVLFFLLPTPDRSYRATGTIEVARSGWEQSDRWTYFAGPSDLPIRVQLDQASWPVLLERSQADRVQLKLLDEGQRLWFEFRLPVGNRIAIVSRQIRPSSFASNSTSVLEGTIDKTSPMSRLAHLLYKDAGETIRSADNQSSPVKNSAPAKNSANDARSIDTPMPVWPTIECHSR